MTKKLRLLIVEDLPSDAELAERELKTVLNNYTVQVVDTEEGFLQALDKFKPDLILSDYQLPAFDGLSALKLIREKYPFMPFIMITGSMNEDTAVECMKAGADDYVIKEHIKRLGPAVINALEKKKIELGSRQAEVALQESEEKYHLLADNSIDVIWQTDLKLAFTYVSPSVENIMGYTVDEWVGSRLSQHSSTKEFFNMAKKALSAIKHYKEFKHLTFETVMLKKDGAEIPVEISSQLLFNKKGLPVGLQGTTRDITERNKAEEQIQKDLREKELLLKEIHHRVKNNLQIICSLLSLQANRITNKKVQSTFNVIRDRIRSMSLVHEKLYSSKDLTKIDIGDYIRSLSSELARVYNVNPDKIEFNYIVQHVYLSVDLSVPCGLIINELISNALKHAFPPSMHKKGKITVSLTKTSTEEIELIVQDNGIGLPKELDIENAESLGLKLVTLLAKDQLGGSVELERNKGVRFRILFKEEII